MIGLIDCNNFFVSCERLFRPDLLHKPVAVLPSNDGCIVARSQEVKDLGIPMGIPYFKVKDICKEANVTLFSSNFPLYRDISERVMHVLKREVEVCEVYSIDEAFFNFSEDTTLESVRKLRNIVIRESGIPVSIGVGDTKTIAKIAGNYAKKGNGVYILNSKNWKQKQSEVTCGSVWGIGRQTTDKLNRIDISSVHDFLELDHAYVKSEFGVMGERMRMELSGVQAYPLGKSTEADHQSIMSTRSFKSTTTERSVVESALGYHITHIGSKLRERNLVASSLRIIAAPSRYGDYSFRKSSADITLDEPTSDTVKLLKEALKLFDSLYDPEVPYKKAGAVVGGIFSSEYVSNSLFTEEQYSDQSLNKITDALNHRFGAGTVHSGIVLGDTKWQSSKELKSYEYTTRWSEICRVKAI